MAAKPGVDDALSYLKRVEQALPRSDFKKFLSIIEDFKLHKITTTDVVARVQALAGTEHSELLADFNNFLPQRHRIENAATGGGKQTTQSKRARVSSSSPPKAKLASSGAKAAPATMSKLERALALVKKIRVRFSDKPTAVDDFVRILNEFQRDRLTVSEARIRVAVLFQGQTDLQQEFDRFLPDKSKISSPSPTTPAARGASHKPVFNPNQTKSSAQGGNCMLSRDKDIDGNTNTGKRKRSNVSNVKKVGRSKPRVCVSKSSLDAGGVVPVCCYQDAHRELVRLATQRVPI